MRISKVNDKNYIVIQGWMLTALHLKGNELLIYACIYGFSQLEGQVFSGSLQYLADWTNSTRQTVINSIKALIEKGYLEKTDKVVNGVKFCEYRAKNLTGVVKNFDWGSQKSCTGGSQKSLPNNLDIDNLENKKVYTRFVKPTLEEVKAYCLERGKGVDAQKWYDYYSANGWKVGKNPMKDWKAAVRTWERSGGNGRSRGVSFTPYPDEY